MRATLFGWCVGPFWLCGCVDVRFRVVCVVFVECVQVLRALPMRLPSRQSRYFALQICLDLDMCGPVVACRNQALQVVSSRRLFFFTVSSSWLNVRMCGPVVACRIEKSKTFHAFSAQDIATVLCVCFRWLHLGMCWIASWRAGVKLFKRSCRPRCHSRYYRLFEFGIAWQHRGVQGVSSFSSVVSSWTVFPVCLRCVQYGVCGSCSVVLFSTSFSSIGYPDSFRLSGLPDTVLFRRFSSVDVRRCVRLAMRLRIVVKMEMLDQFLWNAKSVQSSHGESSTSR